MAESIFDQLSSHIVQSGSRQTVKISEEDSQEVYVLGDLIAYNDESIQKDTYPGEENSLSMPDVESEEESEESDFKVKVISFEALGFDYYLYEDLRIVYLAPSEDPEIGEIAREIVDEEFKNNLGRFLIWRMEMIKKYQL